MKNTIKKLSLGMLSFGALVSVGLGEWGNGLGGEFKTRLVPENQQSGWGYRSETVKKPMAKKIEKPAAPVITQKPAEPEAPVVAQKPAEPKAIPEKNWTLSGVQFEVGSDKLKPETLASLDEASDILKSNARVVVEIQGHTDNTGSPTLNQTLSQRRALAVRNYLVQKGVQENRVEAKGYGASQPVAPNETPTGRTQNRRIDFKVLSH